jgi:hypothetical protein
MSLNTHMSQHMQSAAGVRPAGSVAGEIPLLVISFDRYDDLWAPFFTMFWRHWPDCPFSVHLGTNFRAYGDDRVTTLRTGEEVTWATRYRRLIDTLDSEYVLTILDDFLIHRPVNTSRVLELARAAVDHRVACLRLTPGPPPSSDVPGLPGIGRVDPADPYRVTSQVSFWRTDVLRSLLEPSFSIWDFEFEGSMQSRSITDPFWCVTEPAIHYQHCVERGMWLPWGIRTCRAAGIPIDLTSRPRMRGRELLFRYYIVARSMVSRRLPISVQRRRWLRTVEKTRGRRLQSRVFRAAPTA